MPRQRSPLGRGIGIDTVETVEERAVRDELVHEEGLVGEVEAAAEEPYEVAVVHLAKDSDLVEELVGGPGATEPGALDRGDRAVVEDALEDLAEAAGAEEVVLGEVVRGFGDFFDGEELA